ncbi:MAG: SM-20-related protein [Pseudohongiellaceae bacterium]|jgi:SM-20-related protein
MRVKAGSLMWLNNICLTDSALDNYRRSLLNSCPNYIVIDGLFDDVKLNEVVDFLQQPRNWQPQKHTYSALYVDSAEWRNTSQCQRFVQRDVWQRPPSSPNAAQEFLSFLRGDKFMSLLSRIFGVELTDMNVSEPEINTNYFRLAVNDFVELHADDSPGREVCMLLYLNKGWSDIAGGELGFKGKADSPAITIAPRYNRCVLFNPASTGSEHWVEKLNLTGADQYRYNVTSWYWQE